ncbi:TolC family protein [Chitinophaga sp. Cy-1792]|uniref:TolC family protein n=1 Tax=Chitinophaga sp. Cy-1792 TaxID=2608339 RepID=UPI00142100FE|nr:TolC family protein [Chitinophaga sp. Cy-1792]NIG54138.1 TolC family protein [Chitinophaga sp. Cy-1792]
MLHLRVLALLSLPFFAAQAVAQSNLSLQQTVRTARSSNPVLKTEILNTSAARADIITAGLRPNPQLNNQTLQLANDKYFAPDTKFGSAHNRQVWWQLTKQFQFSGQRKYRLEVAGENLNITEKTYADTERNILSSTANKWLDVWFNKVNLLLVQDAKINLDSLVQTQEIRLKNQVISNSDLLRTQLLQEQYVLQLKTAEQDYKNELQHLKLLTGIKDSISVDENDPVVNPQLIQELDSLVSESVHQRPDMQVAQNAISAAKSNIRLQRAMAVPAPELGFIWNPQNTVPYFGIYGTIDLPFFNRNQGEVKKSRILLQQTELSYDALKKQVETEVATSYRTYQVNAGTVEKYHGILSKAEQVLTAVRYSYTRGGTTIIDFLDAQRTWFDTQKMYNEALYNYRKSYLQLLTVTGLINQL